MPRNLEIKVKLSSHKEVKSIIKKNKIGFAGLLIQKDIYYKVNNCLLYTSDAADERSSVDLGGRRIIKKKKKEIHDSTPTRWKKKDTTAQRNNCTAIV